VPHLVQPGTRFRPYPFTRERVPSSSLARSAAPLEVPRPFSGEENPHRLAVNLSKVNSNGSGGLA
jgi:hypothetical protein